MIRLSLLVAALTLSACGVDGAPRRPAAKPEPQSGVTISGHATVGVVTEL